ncbi:MAG: ACS family MFS transporter [Panacagrimonas sp.]
MASGPGKRHMLVLMCFAAAFVCYIDRVNISIAIIPMAEHFGWSATQKGFVLSSFFIGYMLGQIPSGWMANRIGGKVTLGAALLIWSAFTAITPVAAMAGFTALILSRIVMGMGEAATFPASYNLFAKWIPRQERSRAVAFTLGGIPMGTVIGLAASGALVAQFGWESVFYVFGAVGIVLAIFWFIAIHDSPARHPGISEAECAHIAAGLSAATAERTPLPVAKLLKAPAFWALVVNHFCSNWILYVLLSWMPSYFRDVQGLNLAKAGFAAAAPWLSMFVMANLSAWVADETIRRGVSVSLVRKLMQAGGLLGASAFMLLINQVQTPTAAILVMCGALGALGLTWAGYAPNHLEIAPKHADILMGITNTAGTLPGIIGVAVAGWMLDTTGSYVSVFLLAAGITSVGALVWIVFSRSEPILD